MRLLFLLPVFFVLSLLHSQHAVGNDVAGVDITTPAVLIDPTGVPAYLQLRRDVLINADLWEDEPRILAAGFGFEGIQGVPGLLSASNLSLAVSAGAGVNLDWAALDPVPPLRNLTSAGSPIGIVLVGFGAWVEFADAMPIEFSWQILPSTVSPASIAITLNTGEVVYPEAAALNPNYDYNERHVIVVFGEFGNRLLPGESDAVYPIGIEIVAGRLHATDTDCRPVIISEAGRRYDLGTKWLEVVGIAELGAPPDGPVERAYYVEDHDNYFDIILKGDAAAVARINSVEIPTAAVPGYFDIYNPGGPGRTPDPGTTYTRPALPQLQPVFVSLDEPRTVSYAEQDLDRYDLDDDLPVVFRLRDAIGPDRFTSSTIQAQAWVSEGLTAAGVDFPNEMARPGVAEVRAFYHAEKGDRIYTASHSEWSQLAAEDSGWADEGRAFGAFATPQPGAGPMYRFFDQRAQRRHYTPDFRDGQGMRYEGIAWYAAILRPGLAPGRQGGANQVGKRMANPAAGPRKCKT